MKVTFICAGRGGHKPRRLATFTVADDDTVTLHEPFDDLHSAGRYGTGRPRGAYYFLRLGDDGEGYGVFRTVCPSCPLHIERKRDAIEGIARQAANMGMSVVDLSRIC